MIIAIGTLRAPKIEGIKEGIAECPYFSKIIDQIEYITKDVPSGISHMPLDWSEVFQGARNRTNALVREGIRADYYIGIEGGTTRFDEHAYLFGVVCVRDAQGRSHVGVSPMVEVPQQIDYLLYQEKKELGPIMGELSGKMDIRSQNGSMGAWTDDMFTRKDEFVLAFKAAIAPFFNTYYK